MIFLVSSENVAGIDFVSYIIEDGIVTIGNDGLTLCFELVEVVDNTATEEGGIVRKGRLVDNHLSTLCLDTLHYTLYGTLAEIVGVALHRESINTDGALFLIGCIISATVAIVVIACRLEHTVGNEVLAGTVALHDGFDEVFWHIGIVGKKLLGVFWETVTTIAKGRVVVVRTDTWVKSHSVNDGLGIQALHLCVGVEFVEEAHTQCQIGVGEEFHRFSLGESHEECVDVLLDGSFLQ